MMSISTTGEGLDCLLKRRDHLEILRYIRSHHLREPQLVIEHGKAVLGKELTNNKPSSSLSEISSLLGLSLTESEKLSILEQVCRAALDVNDQTLADQCYSNIVSKVNNPNSARVRRLLGLCLEASGDSEGALQLYQDLIKENPANVYALKRLYCMLKAQPNKQAEAMEALKKCLAQGNPSDAPTWLEMGQLCQSMGDIQGSVYCWEELVLIDPLNASLHLTLGELYATLGGITNLQLARRHVCQSLELSHSVRALFSLLSVSSNFCQEASKKKQREVVDSDDLEVAKALVKFSADELSKVYRGTPMMVSTKALIKKHLDALPDGET